MTIYYVMYVLILLGVGTVAESARNPEQRKKRMAAFITIVITLVLGLRHPSMGVDLQYGLPYGYLWSFKRISQFSLAQAIRLSGWLNYERGFIIYNKLLSYVSTEYSWLLFVSAIASIVPVGTMIRRHSKDLIFSAVVYLGLPCFLIPFSGLRQGIAIGICCLAFPFIQKKKLVKFALVVFAATQFHRTAMIFALAYPLYHFRLPQKTRLWTIPALAVVYAARYPLFAIASRLFKDNAVASDTGAMTLMIVFTLIYFFCTLFLQDSDLESAGFLNVFFFACICQCFGSVNQISMRVGYYFMPALAIALPNIIANMTDPNDKKISRSCIMTVFAAYGLYALHGASWAMTNPYHFFWSGV